MAQSQYPRNPAQQQQFITARRRLVRCVDMQFPFDDWEFLDYAVEKVTTTDDHVELGFDGGICIGFSQVEHGFQNPIAVGDHLRLYGKGLGYVVRGIFINGVKVRYQAPADLEKQQAAARTEYESKDKQQKTEYEEATEFAWSKYKELETAFREGRRTEDAFGQTVQEWRDRVVVGAPVFAVRLGGLSFAYDEAIVQCAAVYITLMEEEGFDFKANAEVQTSKWNHINARTFDDPTIDKIGPSGAMMDAARNMAAVLWRQTPVVALSMPDVADRLLYLEGGKIQHCKEHA